MPSQPSKKQRTKTRKQLLAAEALLLLLLRRAAHKDGKGSITQALYRGKQELRALGRKSVEQELETEITKKPTSSARRDLSRAAKVAAVFLAYSKSRTKVLSEQLGVAENSQSVTLLKQQATAAIDNRLRQIAAFEAVRTFEEERRDAAEQIADASEQVMAKRWDASLDSLTCDTCAGLDGREAELDEEFPDGDPPLHPNCRCSIEYRFDT